MNGHVSNMFWNYFTAYYCKKNMFKWIVLGFFFGIGSANLILKNLKSKYYQKFVSIATVVKIHI